MCRIYADFFNLENKDSMNEEDRRDWRRYVIPNDLIKLYKNGNNRKSLINYSIETNQLVVKKRP